jgi:glycosyltransferase involved in cell wall biosynthesis
MPLDSRRYPVRELLSAFRGALEKRPDLHLVLTGRRDPTDEFLAWNYIDKHGLTESIEYLPYYDICREFPSKKQDCTLWIERDTPAADLTPESLLTRLQSAQESQKKLALFVTSFCPAKNEGNSALMRQWLEHLRSAGYRIHLLYYNLQKTTVTERLRQEYNRMADMVVEVDVATRVVGSNRNGLNVHVDDWCGIELLETAESLASRFEYDVALVNYGFLSATFTRISAYTKKILITHDAFADRNRRMLAQGFPESGWLSLDSKGEALAFRRADVVVALQDGEAAAFRLLAGETSDVCVVAPVSDAPQIRPPKRGEKLRIGYLGSHNWVNEHNLIAFLKEWAQREKLVEESELVLAGSICASLNDFMPKELASIAAPRMLGEVESLYTFFEQCDVFINPECGGTGIKIKTLDAMSHGAAILTTVAGGVGIDSRSRFHAAVDAAALADLVAECVDDPELVQRIREESREAYATYSTKHRNSLTHLLGPAVSPLQRSRPELLLGEAGDVENGNGSAAPKVSIVIPVYNVEDYLEACLLSVVGQEMEDFEIIVVDDQSLDGSRAVADRFAAMDDRIRIVTHAKNAGLGPARNTGVRYSRGAYILFLDSDDLMASPKALGQIALTAERTGSQVVIGSCVRLKPDGSIVDEDRERDQQSDGKAGRIVRGVEAFIASLGLPGKDYLPIRAWGTLIQRSYYEDLRLNFPAGEHEDMPTVPFIYFHANSVVYDPLVVVKYRERQQSLSSTQWSAAKLKRYGDIWNLMKTGMQDCGLQEQVGDAAATFACHLMWRVKSHGVTPDAAEVAPTSLSQILQDLSGATNRALMFMILQEITSQPWDSLKSYARHAELINMIPSWALVEFHRERLCIPALQSTPIPKINKIRQPGAETKGAVTYS